MDNKTEFFNKPVFDPLKIYVHPTKTEDGFFIVPPSFDEDGNGLLDDWGFPTAKSLGLFYFTVNTQIKQNRDISHLRWTRWNILNSYTGKMEMAFEGDLVKVVWSEGMIEIPVIYKIQYMDYPEGRYCLLYTNIEGELDYVPIAEFEESFVNPLRSAKTVQIIGNYLNSNSSESLT